MEGGSCQVMQENFGYVIMGFLISLTAVFFVRWKRGESWFINWFGWLYSGHKCLIWFEISTQYQQSFWSQNPKLNQLGLV